MNRPYGFWERVILLAFSSKPCYNHNRSTGPQTPRHRTVPCLQKWTWETFCKKWVWQTFCKDWIANKAWNWFNGDKWYQSLVRNLTIGVVGGIVGALAVWLIPLLSAFAGATLGITVLGGIITGIIGGIVSWLYDLIS